MIENAIRQRLLQVPTVTVLVGDRVTHGVADQGERRSRIVLTLLDASPEYTFDGPAGFRTSTIQIACLAQTYKAAHDLAEAARTAVDCYSGTIAGVQIEHVEIEGIEDIDSEPLDGQAVPTFGKRLTVWTMQES
jgi:hypothetical protein